MKVQYRNYDGVVHAALTQRVAGQRARVIAFWRDGAPRSCIAEELRFARLKLRKFVEEQRHGRLAI